MNDEVSTPTWALMIGSHRAGSASNLVAQQLIQRLETIAPAVRVEAIDLAAARLPFWGEPSEEGAGSSSAWSPISRTLEAAEALIAVVPEWHGMVPAAVKNLFLYLSDELAHKPGLIVSISATQGGAYPVAELRLSSYKNSRICWIPEHLIVRGCKAGDANATQRALAAIDERIDHALRLLGHYAHALRGVRQGMIGAGRSFAFGM
mgnify:FL=1